MANYLVAIKTDSSGKKFLQVLSDNSGNNEFMAIQGGAPVTQNGELVAPLIITPSGDIQIITTQLPASLGQKAMAASLPVVLASDQTPFNVVPSCDKAYAPAADGDYILDVGHVDLVYGFYVISSDSDGRFALTLDNPPDADHTYLWGVNTDMNSLIGQTIMLPAPYQIGAGMDLRVVKDNCLVIVYYKSK